MTDGTHPRRTMLRALGTAGSVALAGCSSFGEEPTVSVTEAALIDERIPIELDGLPANERVTLRASARSGGFPTDWESLAVFESDENGRVQVPEQAPVEGTYERVDAMGLFWSMRPAGLPSDEPASPAAWFQPGDLDAYDVHLTAEVDGAVVASATTERRLADPEIEERSIDRDDLVGEFYAPPDGGPAPGVLLLHGSEGQPMRRDARLLASRGFAALALHYFGDPDPIPDHLIEVPVEYAEIAADWLHDQPEVNGPGIGVFGYSRGSVLALLLASRRQNVDAVVGEMPSPIVWEGIEADRSHAGTSAWTVDSDPVPYLQWAEPTSAWTPGESRSLYERGLENASADEIEAATIPVEEIDAPILLLSGTDDRRWPSTAFSELAVERLDEHGFSHEYDHVAYEGAGHAVPRPYLPTVGTDALQTLAFGGSPKANARASEDSWERTMSVFEGALGGERGQSITFRSTEPAVR